MLAMYFGNTLSNTLVLGEIHVSFVCYLIRFTQISLNGRGVCKSVSVLLVFLVYAQGVSLD